MLQNELITQEQHRSLEKFEEAKGLILAISEQCKNIVVVDSSSVDSVRVLLKSAKQISTMIEEKRKEITKPILTFKSNVDKYATDLTLDLDNSVKGLRGRLLKFLEEEEAKRLAELRILEQERAAKEKERHEMQAKLNEQIVEGSVAVTVNDSQQLINMKHDELDIVRQQKSIEETKSGGLSSYWDLKVTNPEIVPLAYLIVDEKAIKAAIKAGVREIPGVTIFQDNRLVVR
jgi:hypothetical protein